MEPPTFQEAPRCDVCKCSFNAFRRRHHCRSCGRTLCHEHSASQMALPQFGIYSPVRVCSDCFNGSSRPAKGGVQASSDGTDSVTAAVSRLDIGGDSDSKTKPTIQSQPVSAVIECKCGMPLCICEAPAPSVVAAPIQSKTTSAPVPHCPRPKKTETAVKTKPSTSNSKHSSVFNLGQANNGVSDKKMDYEVNGEGMREAIKNGDIDAVKKLLSEGVNANYHDKQGLSLLHLAAVFNQTEIVFALMDSGGSLDYKNAQGETPLDCAPVTLQYKMRQKMEEDRRV
ncbi:putative chromatin regulator PHD family [Rosa chinensis]|uniref:Putative chromatin regulator PHD family n=1 Tax=Rosa chinensis TaxID=74649 RepID=A0A2P6RL40_ROSCH|nr:vacuolar protein sorting-associated protein 27 [Rosa chinensis]XP_024185565.1 vacuolar protein sorting-associated protein 27 [Rosa chinensis]PRQ47145.1 putative chromatin regulator PHD family [Rosa chinensis]